MRIKPIFLIASLAGLLCNSSCADLFEDSDGSSSSPAEWTFAVYMAADNNLAYSGVLDLFEMERVGSSDELNVVVQAEFSEHHMVLDDGSGLVALDPSDLGLQTYQTSRFRVTADGDPYLVDSAQQVIGDRDMAGTEALANFIKWVKSDYPAEHYALVLWNHGSGWAGALQDESANHYMTMPELEDALIQGGLKLDIINFDACLMGMYEVAALIKDHAEFMVASEHTIPGLGNPYHMVLADLARDPGMSPRELASSMVDDFESWYSMQDESITLSALDLSQFEQLDVMVGELGRLLFDGITTGMETDAIEQARSAARYYHETSHKDFYHFLENIELFCTSADIRGKAGEIKDHISSSLVINNTWKNSTLGMEMSGSHGVAVLVPSPGDLPDSGRSSLDYYTYAHENWKDFVTLMAGQGYSVIETGFSFLISWDNPDADVDLYVEEPSGEWASPWMGSVSSNGILSVDSYDSGVPMEFYDSQDYVMPGVYVLFANLYSMEGQSGQTINFYVDTDTADGFDYQLCDSFTFDSTNPAPAYWWEDPQEADNVASGEYSDWYISESCSIVAQ